MSVYVFWILCFPCFVKGCKTSSSCAAANTCGQHPTGCISFAAGRVQGEDQGMGHSLFQKQNTSDERVTFSFHNAHEKHELSGKMTSWLGGFFREGPDLCPNLLSADVFVMLHKTRLQFLGSVGSMGSRWRQADFCFYLWCSTIWWHVFHFKLSVNLKKPVTLTLVHILCRFTEATGYMCQRDRLDRGVLWWPMFFHPGSGFSTDSDTHTGNSSRTTGADDPNRDCNSPGGAAEAHPAAGGNHSLCLTADPWWSKPSTASSQLWQSKPAAKVTDASACCEAEDTHQASVPVGRKLVGTMTRLF